MNAPAARKLAVGVMACAWMTACSEPAARVGPDTTAASAVADALAELPARATADAAGQSDTPSADVATPPADAAPLRVLFLGNSYTYVNDLPAMTAAFAASAGVTVQTAAVTLGGASLQVLAMGTAALPTVAQGGWKFVVVQGQSLEPLDSPGAFALGAKTLADAAKAVGAVPAFYTTWPRAPGNGLYWDAITGGTPGDMAQRLQDGYQQAADANGGIRVRVGDAWMLVLTGHPGVEMYQADGSHPSVAGTYLAACVFAATLAGVAPAEVTWHPPEVSEADAVALREVCRSALACTGPNPTGCLAKPAALACQKSPQGETLKCVANAPGGPCSPAGCQCNFATGQWDCDSTCSGGVCRPLCELVPPTVMCCQGSEAVKPTCWNGKFQCPTGSRNKAMLGCGPWQGDPTPGVVACGAAGANCPSGEVCCVSATAKCTPAAATAGCAAVQACDAPQDCPAGQTCCIDASGPNLSTACQPGSTCPKKFVACQSDADCIPGLACCFKAQLGAFGVCGWAPC